MSPKTLKLARLWIGASILYGLFRVFLVWSFLAEYHVNPLVFSVVELLSSGIYGWSSGRVVMAVSRGDVRQTLTVGAIAISAFTAPDIYVFGSIEDPPHDLFRTVVLVIVSTSLVTIIGLVIRLVSARRLRQPAHVG